MFIESDRKVLNSSSADDQGKRSDIVTYLRQLKQNYNERTERDSNMFKALETTPPATFTPVDDGSGRPDSISYLRSLRDEKEASLRENAVLLSLALGESRTTTERDMKDEMQEAATEAARKVEQSYIARGLYKPSDGIGHVATIKQTKGDYQTDSEVRRDDLLRSMLPKTE